MACLTHIRKAPCAKRGKVAKVPTYSRIDKDGTPFYLVLCLSREAEQEALEKPHWRVFHAEFLMPILSHKIQEVCVCDKTKGSDPRLSIRRVSVVSSHFFKSLANFFLSLSRGECAKAVMVTLQVI